METATTNTNNTNGTTTSGDIDVENDPRKTSKMKTTPSSSNDNINGKINSQNQQKNEATISDSDSDIDDYTSTTTISASATTIPRHVGLICDGNGRWANRRNLPRAVGHAEGARRLVDLIRSLTKERRVLRRQARARTQTQRRTQQRENRQQRNDTNAVAVAAVDCLTFYAFSTENWNRSPQEITKIFEAIEFTAKIFLNSGELQEMQIRVLGDLDDPRIPSSLRKILRQLEDRTNGNSDGDNSNSTSASGTITTTSSTPHRARNHDRLGVCLAINYGGRRDIVAACRAVARDVQNGSLDPSDVSEATISDRLGTAGLEAPDLVVRTGGEHRLSNFMLWEAAYAELRVVDTLWPDFSYRHGWKEALDWYAGRKRNFGGRATATGANADTNANER